MKNFLLINKFFIKFLIIVIGYVNVNYADLNGPFLIWTKNNNLYGLEQQQQQQQKQQSTILNINEFDENQLISIYSNVKIILLFQKFNSQKLKSNNFPCTKNLIMKDHNYWMYIPYRNLPVGPFDFNDNIEIINLDNNDTKLNDKLLCEIFDERSNKFDNNILGIISNSLSAKKFKRSTNGNHNKQKITHPILYSDYDENVLLYSSAPPILTIIKENFYINDEPNEEIIMTLNHPKHIDIEGVIDANNDNNIFNFTIIYEENKNQNITLRIPFRTQLGYWSFSSIEVETDTLTSILNVMGDHELTAPHGFSYACGRKLLFMDDNGNTLTMKDIQVEPIFWKTEHRNETKFSDAYDCVGFMTVPILAGIFVTFLLLTVTFIGIILIMEIKTPIRFDKDKIKQLTINLNEKDVRN